jgi:ankyrin repeat protein
MTNIYSLADTQLLELLEQFQDKPCLLPVEYLAQLLDNGANPNLRDHQNTWHYGYGSTPLHWAADCRHAQASRILLENGADPNLYTDDMNATPLHFACSVFRGTHKSSPDVVSLLIASGGDVAARDKDGETPLHYACWNGRLDIVHLLINNGADPLSRDRLSMTPLHRSTVKPSAEVAEFLISKGADILAKNSDGHTPLFLCLNEHFLEFETRSSFTEVLLQKATLMNMQSMAEELSRLEKTLCYLCSFEKDREQIQKAIKSKSTQILKNIILQEYDDQTSLS